MTEKLSDLFERAQAPTVPWRGHLVYSTFELPLVRSGTSIRIAFDDPSPARPQGLRVKARGGTIRVGDLDFDDLVFWSDTAPRVVAAQVQSTATEVRLRFWNCWRDPHEVMQAWIGNSGMLVEQTGSGFRLRCSDGFDDVTFDDMVASVELSAPSPSDQSKPAKSDL